MTFDAERWERIEALFAQVVELPEAERAPFLDRAGVDPEVRREVERLLHHDQGRNDPLLDAIDGLADGIGTPAPSVRERIGDYKVLRELGRGGMGAVYLAARDDGEFRREVAIKVVLGGVGGGELLDRFRRERRILASLDHPNIARLIDGGATEDGLPYLVMDYVDGVPVQAYCDGRRLDVDGRLGLFREICAAVQYAHRNLIVHRDIKPANILVTRDGQPKLLDFGIAKLLETEGGDSDARTATRLMTPEFASPEQIRGGPITISTDVYSLGLLLYELLTGRRPYALEGRGFDVVARAITETEPERPSQAVRRPPLETDPGGADSTVERIAQHRSSLPEGLRRRLAGDLDQILLTALRKEPERRYSTVEQFSEDVRRHLEGLPVSARADSWRYRATKFVRRHPWGVATAATILLLVAGSSVAFRAQAERIAIERDRARIEAATATRVTDFMIELFEDSTPAEARGRDIPVSEVLERGARRVRAELAGEVEVQARLMRAIAEVYGNLSRYDEAVPLAEEAVEKQRALYGEESAEYAAALKHLGTMRMQLGDEEGAERDLSASLAIRRRLFDPPHDDLADGLNGLGWYETKRANYGTAETLTREALAMWIELHGERHATVAHAKSNLGRLLHETGRLDEAEASMRQALEIYRELYGEDHPSVATVLNNLGQLLTAEARYDEAEPVKQETVDLMRRLHGDDSVPYALSLNNFATFYKEIGDAARSERMTREGTAILRERLGDEHPLVLVGMNNLANLLHDQGRLAEAERLHRQSLELHRRVRGEKHPTTAGVMNNLAALLKDMEQYDEAETLYRRTIALDLEALGPEHPFVAMDYGNLAILLRDRGRAADREEAERLFVDSIELAAAGLGESHPTTAGNRAQYGIFLVRSDRLDEAERQIRRALEAFERPEMKGAYQIAQTRSILGDCLAARGDRLAAEPLLIESYDALRRDLGDRSGVTQRARARLVGFYESVGQYDRARAVP